LLKITTADIKLMNGFNGKDEEIIGFLQNDPVEKDPT
jgi:hypothetical protein